MTSSKLFIMHSLQIANQLFLNMMTKNQQYILTNHAAHIESERIVKVNTFDTTININETFKLSLNINFH